MKNDILHSGRLFSIQRQHNYKLHLQKINRIQSKQNKKAHSTQQIISAPSHLSTLPFYPSGYKIQQQIRIKQQNNRLLKRLHQISKRKKYEVLSPGDQYDNLIKFNQLQKKHKDYVKQQKQKQIQEENTKLVEKLLERFKSNKNKEQFFRDQSDMFLLRKSRTKQKHKQLLKSQQKSRLKKSVNERKNNNSQIQGQNSLVQTLQKAKNQRKRNYSTLLPTIQKMHNTNNVDQKNKLLQQKDMYSVLSKYQFGMDSKKQKEGDKSLIGTDYQKKQSLNQNQTKNDSENKNIIKNQSKQLKKYNEDENYEMEYEDRQNQENNLNLNKNNRNTNQSNRQDQSQQTILPQPNSQQSLTGSQQHVMSPSLKFDKLKKKVTKKRQIIQQVKQQNDYIEQIDDITKQ